MPFIVALQRWWQQTILWFSVALLVALVTVPIGLFVWLLFSTNIFTVQAITVVDARPHTTEAVKTLLGGLRGDSIFLVLPEALEQRIMTALPQVRTVHITRKLPGTIKIVVQEKTPTLLLLTGGDYYFVDQEGVAYEEARLENLPGVVLPVVKNTDTPVSTVTLGAPVVEQSFVGFVHDIQKKLPEKLGFRVAEIRIPSLSAREVSFTLDNNWLIRFDVARPAEHQLAVLARVLDDTMSDQERDNLEYVDLRIQNRVYYKASALIP